MEVIDAEHSARSSQAPSAELDWSGLLAAYRLRPEPR
jgi:hypothetical protein